MENTTTAQVISKTVEAKTNLQVSSNKGNSRGMGPNGEISKEILKHMSTYVTRDRAMTMPESIVAPNALSNTGKSLANIIIPVA